eukprot:CAMPEP_0194246656 /NCGR_PEP_ID=MMETSP0158-20130606/15356_1 /TAXON_ID=33649 /ORGANISM="Thalassionema nitzschioides, Strain L26-B" /LENGTH=245 /DNA_ID=CAMNT_0038982605 /DNA_START=23 /DNA_END=760 /DNA_ORIENTATION=-
MTDFQVEKIERAYMLKDFNGDGVVEEIDFILWGQKACATMNVEFTEEKKKAWTDAFHAFFDGTFSKEENSNKIISWQEAVGDETCLAETAKINGKLFESIDANNDGVVSWVEFFAFVGAITGITEEAAKIAFDMIDENKDGVLSKEEFSVALAHYYLDKEDTPYKHFYGYYESSGHGSSLAEIKAMAYRMQKDVNVLVAKINDLEQKDSNSPVRENVREKTMEVKNSSGTSISYAVEGDEEDAWA